MLCLVAYIEEEEVCHVSRVVERYVKQNLQPAGLPIDIEFKVGYSQSRFGGCTVSHKISLLKPEAKTAIKICQTLKTANRSSAFFLVKFRYDAKIMLSVNVMMPDLNYFGLKYLFSDFLRTAWVFNS